MEEDRISQLPDAILQQILSLIDTNEALQTTILSKRWKNLSLSISDLKFHLTALAARRHVTLKPRQTAQSFSDHRFSPSISHFLSRRDGAIPLRSFHLSFDSPLVHAHAPLIDKCVRYAVSHGVHSLRLHGRCRPDLSLPTALYASTTLQELELRKLRYVLCKSDELSLPYLKTLYLYNTAFVENIGRYSNVKEPFWGFPELEKLTISRSLVYGLVVKAPKLRILEIIHQEDPCSHMMGGIWGPLLTRFRYEGFRPLECSKIYLPMLEELHLNVYQKQQEPDYVPNEKMWFQTCVRMLRQLGNAKIVALSLDTLKFLEMDLRFIGQSPCPFPYMKCLRLVKGHREIPRVLHGVVNYLTKGNLNLESLRVELPKGVTVVQKNLEDLFEDDDDDQQLQLLFRIEDEISIS